VAPQVTLLRRLVVAHVARVADPHVGNLHVLIDLVAEVGHVGALVAADLRQVLLMSVDPVCAKGLFKYCTKNMLLRV
jgi:hypothetical protein